MQKSDSGTQIVTVSQDDISKRLDVFVAEKTGITRSQVQKLIIDGFVRVNGKTETRNYRVRAGDHIEIQKPAEHKEVLVPEPIALKILFKDEYLVVVDKPAGMVVYPAAGHVSGTLVNAVMYHCGKVASVGGPLRPGVVQRLDKDTSGVMVVALDDAAYYNLIAQFKSRSIKKTYHALVYGDLHKESGEIILKIGRSQSDRKKMSTRSRRGKEAVTGWRVIRRFTQAALVEVQLRTGRTHQIRVHFSAIGHPVLGDRTYGRKSAIATVKGAIAFPRQMLHAATLAFAHPVTNNFMEFSSPLPKDMEECIALLDKMSGNVTAT